MDSYLVSNGVGRVLFLVTDIVHTVIGECERASVAWLTLSIGDPATDRDVAVQIVL